MAPLWERLVQTQRHSIFQSFSWNRLAAEVFADRISPFVVCVESDSGAAIIPAGINHSARQIELLGESLFDYRDVLHAGSAEVLRVAWQRVAEAGLPLSVTALEAPAAEARWREFPLATFSNAPGVCGLTEQEFRSRHSRLGRHYRRLQKAGVRLRSSSGMNSGLVRHLYERKGEQFAGDPENVFRDAARREFMVAVAAAEGERCEIFTLESGSELVAGLVSFRDQDVRRFYTIYFDPAWARYSPGVVLVCEITARSLAEGLGCDYMTGEYTYKTRLANDSRPLYKVNVSAAELAEIASRNLLPTAA